MINSIELFCGAGGLAIGLQKAGINHNALFEWDEYSCENIEKNIEAGYALSAEWTVNKVDVRSVDYEQYRGRIDIVSGGPPCQPFSFGGKGEADKDERDMWPEAIRAVREIRPKAFIFENVKGLLRDKFKDYFEYIILQLSFPSIECLDNNREEHFSRLKSLAGNPTEIAEYSVTFHSVDVADYGVPQSRRRVFVIGFRRDLGIQYSFPTPSHSKEALWYDQWVTGSYWKEYGIPVPKCEISKSQLDKLKKKPPKARRWRTVRDVIGDLPKPSEKGTDGISNHEYRDGAKEYKGHTGSRLDSPSKTIKAGVHGVPGGENTVIMDDGTLRYYTVRESARIQTFDDEYEFFCPWGEAMRQIGNAVPVRMAEIVGKSVVMALGGNSNDE